MTAPLILVVEDNDDVRGLVSDALSSAGFAVTEAADGAQAMRSASENLPDLILQDLLLPDMDGFALLGQLRALPGGATRPILAFTGFLTQLPEDRSGANTFDALVRKPVGVSNLVATVRARLPSLLRAPVPTAAPRTVLVVDDEPSQRKLACLRLARMGFATLEAGDGIQALETARRTRPDAILTDMLMPRMDGFALCSELRSDPTLRTLPIVLRTNATASAADRLLARELGANVFLSGEQDRSGDKALDAVRELLDRAGGARAARPAESRARPRPGNPARTFRIASVQRRFARQLALNVQLATHSRLQTAAITMLGSIADMEPGGGDDRQAVCNAFLNSIDASGVLGGALFLEGADGALRLAARKGFAGLPDEPVGTCFGNPALLDQVRASGTAAVLAARAGASPHTARLLAACRADIAVVTPIHATGGTPGVMLFVAHCRRVDENEVITVASAIAAQLGRAMTLRQTLSRLAASEHRYRILMERASEAVLVLSLSGVIRECNQRAEVMHQRSRSEIVGHAFREFLLDNDQADAETSFSRLLTQGYTEAPYRATMRRGDGAEVRLQCSASVIDVGGEPVVLAFVQDITEQLWKEEETRQAQKLEALGQLAGGVAHDFNNLMVAVLANASMVLDSLPPGDPRREDLLDIRAAGQRATALTRQLLAFGRRQVLDPTEVDLNEVVLGMRTLLCRVLRQDITVVTELGPDLGAVRVDRGQLEQVIVNLAVNARDAMPYGGRLTLKTATTEVPASLAPGNNPLAPGRYVVLSVVDTGVGMTEAVRRRVFEPFFTTKSVGEGTGLGLSTSYGIACQSRGTIRVESEPGRGSVFRVFLPWVPGPAQRPVVPPAPVVTGGDETILIVEDDPIVRRVSARVLRGRGYRVLEACDGYDALVVASEHTGVIHLLLSDVTLPRMSGIEAGRQLLAMRPGLRAVFMSGFSAEAVTRDGVLRPNTPLLEKPFTPAQLERVVRETLDSPVPR